MNKINIPQTVKTVIKCLVDAGFEAFVVGGCVRDVLSKRDPRDWDVTTSAKPEEILTLFPKSKYENKFGTVLIPEKYLGGDEDEKGIIEITTFRIESEYSDKRHPDEVKFAKTLKEDLSRRDFTVNAMAIKVKSQKSKVKSTIKNSKTKKTTIHKTSSVDCEIIDLYGGRDDLKEKVIRAVGDHSKRFEEDALRMMRAVRFATQLSEGEDLSFLKERKGTGKQNKEERSGLWRIGERTFSAIKKNNDLLKHISPERIRDELIKIILSDRPAWGIELLVETELMRNIIPELYDTIGVRQNRHHYHGPYNTVYKHILAALKTCPSEKLEVRLAAFFHDIGKPKSKRGEGEFSTFYGHEYIGARMTKEILERLKFSRKIVDKATLLVKNHMFYYNVDEVGERGVRKVIRKVGLENINDLIDVRIGDRLGSGVAKAVPYKLRHFKYMVEKVSADPVSLKQLKINGNDLMEKLKMKPGSKIGAILEVLLAEVIDDPKLNDEKLLLKRADKLQTENLEDLKKKAKQKIAEERQEDEEEMKEKYWVK